MKYKKWIEQMTLEEKASLMSGKDFWQTQDIERLGINSIFLADGPHGIRRQAVAADKLGLNEGMPATCYPTAATVANSWNAELGEKVGEYLGEEALAQRVNVLLGPGVNMKRNPLCGRNFEYFSEDPYLAGKMAAGYIRGIQSHGISACVKHFAANNQEEKRMTIDTIVDERTLRELYLTAFEICVEEGKTKSIMSSYNKLNGTYTNEHMHLMQDILRNEWGYTGTVITEWGGSNDRVQGLLAGNELEMPTTAGETDKEIVDAIKSGQLSEEVLDEAVDRLLDLIFSTEAAFQKPIGQFDVEKHHRVSQKVAEESIVLLKNDENILPLKFGKKVAVVGEFAQNARYQGAGSSIVNPTILDHTMDCFEESGIVSIGYEPGFERYGKKNQQKIDQACELAQKADVVLLYIGLDEATEADGLDRKNMKIPDNQIDLLEALYEVNTNIIAIISCGSAVEMPWIGKVKGLLHGYLGGQAGARAILRVLSGDVNPSGKLAESYPLRYEDTPSYKHFPGKEATVEYRESLYIGYRYYDTAEVDVLFPFGFGLSYTSFEYTDLKVDRKGVTFQLTNTGDRAGMEVAQLYVGCTSDNIFRPKKELKGFKKVFINAGESKHVRIPFDNKTFRYFNVKTNKWEIEEAYYTIMIGASSADIKLQQQWFAEGTNAPLPYEKEKLPSYYSGKVNDVSVEEFEQLIGRKIPEPTWDRTQPLGYNDTIAQCQYAKGWFGRVAYYSIIQTQRFLRKIGKRSTANIMDMSILNLPFRGIARMTGGIVNMPMLDGILLMVNGHFFKGLWQVTKEKAKLIKAKRKSKADLMKN
ncbi:beta-glucosidase family protein [Shouchella clausii]|uniref:beta-glucosidase family protein n=1 Tax=Shouchella clausii TaxID=79880 RepID=UPI000B97A5FD|nr:glycoside hydrolase family 3 C-terminal domain-containing protein [Shouchella clausii]AST96263.1 glycosyl hydrolase [Shouchella clausii]MCR1289926.1 glycoside hydrolase family 3 C-terminal domain-containing protein [Shouchella clausii]MEB5473528.1 glycoside hydrolase family 3 C-terminal domain-containing protein [Shouchella clausii]QNM42622.1 glycosyl hydrolase [Shouchella clausii]WQG94525.1 glycoside hydrolase family 3 C-terminal domain-containing protein [Shouchella clausii]